jgi:hypothetical protein
MTHDRLKKIHSVDATATQYVASKQNMETLKFSHLSPGSLTPFINLYIRICSRIFVKIRNCSYRVFMVMEETDL